MPSLYKTTSVFRQYYSLYVATINQLENDYAVVAQTQHLDLTTQLTTKICAKHSLLQQTTRLISDLKILADHTPGFTLTDEERAFEEAHSNQMLASELIHIEQLTQRTENLQKTLTTSLDVNSKLRSALYKLIDINQTKESLTPRIRAHFAEKLFTEPEIPAGASRMYINHKHWVQAYREVKATKVALDTLLNRLIVLETTAQGLLNDELPAADQQEIRDAIRYIKSQVRDTEELRNSVWSKERSNLDSAIQDYGSEYREGFRDDTAIDDRHEDLPAIAVHADIAKVESTTGLDLLTIPERDSYVEYSHRDPRLFRKVPILRDVRQAVTEKEAAEAEEATAATHHTPKRLRA